MTDALHTLLAPFKRQLADLEQAHAAGTLSQTQRDTERASLERRLLDMLLHETPAPVPAAAKPAWPLLVGLFVLVLVIAIGGYTYNHKTNPAQGDVEGADGGGYQAQVVAMVEQLAELGVDSRVTQAVQARYERTVALMGQDARNPPVPPGGVRSVSPCFTSIFSASMPMRSDTCLKPSSPIGPLNTFCWCGTSRST